MHGDREEDCTNCTKSTALGQCGSVGRDTLVMGRAVLPVSVYQLPLQGLQLTEVADIEPEHDGEVGGEKTQQADIAVGAFPENIGFFLKK